MNREILFRAKHIHAIPGNEHLNGIWVHGYLSDENYIYDKSLEGEFLIDENTICQYTELTNELGEEFWENNIVQCGHYYGVIKYEEGAFIIKWNTKGSEFLRHDLAYWAYLSNVRVVGNIFDNPELLEEENMHGTD